MSRLGELNPTGFFAVYKGRKYCIEWESETLKAKLWGSPRCRAIASRGRVNKKENTMSRNYKFRNLEGIYFISFAVVNWLDVFTVQKHSN